MESATEESPRGVCADVAEPLTASGEGLTLEHRRGRTGATKNDASSGHVNKQSSTAE